MRHCISVHGNSNSVHTSRAKHFYFPVLSVYLVYVECENTHEIIQVSTKIKEKNYFQCRFLTKLLKFLSKLCLFNRFKTEILEIKTNFIQISAQQLRERRKKKNKIRRRKKCFRSRISVWNENKATVVTVVAAKETFTSAVCFVYMNWKNSFHIYFKKNFGVFAAEKIFIFKNKKEKRNTKQFLPHHPHLESSKIKEIIQKQPKKRNK